MPLQEKPGKFINWCAQHIAGDENGQAQVFLDQLFVLNPTVTAPGIPRGCPEPQSFLTEDCNLPPSP